MAIFARLVLMLFGIVTCIGVGATLMPGLDGLWGEDIRIYGGIGGGVVGVAVGQFLGYLVVGKPPKD